MSSVVPIAERRDALVLKFLIEIVHYRACHHLTRMRVVAHQERQIEDVKFFDAKRTEFSNYRCQKLNRAALQGLELLFILIERGVWINFDRDPAVGAFLSQLLEEQGGFAFWGVRRHDVTKLDDDRIGECS